GARVWALVPKRKSEYRCGFAEARRCSEYPWLLCLSWLWAARSRAGPTKTLRATAGRGRKRPVAEAVEARAAEAAARAAARRAGAGRAAGVRRVAARRRAA